MDGVANESQKQTKRNAEVALENPIKKQKALETL
jgi:hypothetical protein